MKLEYNQLQPEQSNFLPELATWLPDEKFWRDHDRGTHKATNTAYNTIYDLPQDILMYEREPNGSISLLTRNSDHTINSLQKLYELPSFWQDLAAKPTDYTLVMKEYTSAQRSNPEKSYVMLKRSLVTRDLEGSFHDISFSHVVISQDENGAVSIDYTIPKVAAFGCKDFWVVSCTDQSIQIKEKGNEEPIAVFTFHDFKDEKHVASLPKGSPDSLYGLLYNLDQTAKDIFAFDARFGITKPIKHQTQILNERAKELIQISPV